MVFESFKMILYCFLGGTTAGLTNTTASIFNQTPAKTVTLGLGGVDPKTATTSASNTGDGSKTR